ncbi:hypothetical protein [Thioalkalivibrio thiocyanodenitrificans]|uniref:hypothetical protein n=1 Tax=Thioalkalivibrio thiocyanodenitrificans TaxID=243063 RepID=UPI00037CCB12|nr:hypothetical protein [Thioalkalivibrio thiocyanodenitrificans]
MPKTSRTSKEVVSGNIVARPDRLAHDGVEYFIVNRIGQEWGVPTQNISPKDLRAMADHLEAIRAANQS